MNITTIEGGYTLVEARALGSVLALLKEGAISYRSARAYFSCLSIAAIRFAAQCKTKRKKFFACYSLEELHSYVKGVGGEYLRSDLRELSSKNLIEFSSKKIRVLSGVGGEEVIAALNSRRSPNRYIPVPRRMLEYLSSCERPTVTKTVLALILRALGVEKDKTIKTLGSIKASLIASATGISLRSVRSARKILIQLGFITPDTNSTQRKLNKTGSYFAINTSWNLPSRIVVQEEAQNELLNSCSESEFAPPSPLSTPKSAPPIENQIPPIIETSKYQKTPKSGAGVLYNPQQVDYDKLPTPNIKNILKDDLFHFPRLEALYHQALKLNWFTHSENMVLNWLSAAVHARSATNGNPVKIFVAIIKQKLWHHITNKDEDLASASLKRFREKNYSFYQPLNTPRQQSVPNPLNSLLGALFKKFI
jgi:hypothetical protein